MPSSDWPRAEYAALSRTDLTANEIHGISVNFKHGQRREADRFGTHGVEERQGVDARVTSACEKAKPEVGDAQQFLSQAKAGRKSARELAAFIEQREAFKRHFLGDGEKGGLIASFESGYERAQRIIDDPGAYADDLYRRYPSLAEGRFHIR